MQSGEYASLAKIFVNFAFLPNNRLSKADFED